MGTTDQALRRSAYRTYTPTEMPKENDRTGVGTQTCRSVSELCKLQETLHVCNWSFSKGGRVTKIVTKIFPCLRQTVNTQEVNEANHKKHEGNHSKTQHNQLLKT